MMNRWHGFNAVIGLGGLVCLLSGVALGAAPTTGPAGLPAFRGGGALVGVGESIGPPPMRTKWTYRTGDGAERASVTASPVVDGNTLYIADGKGTLHAVDLMTGQARWTFRTEDSFAATPLVHNGVVYLGDLTGFFHAISAETGKPLWKIDTEAPINCSANVAGSTIVFANDGAEMFAVNAEGKILWRAQAGDRINSAPALANAPPATRPAPTDRPPPLLAFFGGCDGQLRALDASTGKELFAVDLGAPIAGSPAVVGDRVVVGTDLGKVYCISISKRQILWTYQNPDSEMLFYASPAVAENVVVIGSRDRQIHALDLESGVRLWTFKTRGDVDASPVISSGRVYAASKDRNLYVLDLKTGKLLWSFNTARPIEASPAIARGLLIVPDTSGTVFCLEPR